MFCAAFNCSTCSKSGFSLFTFPKDEKRCKEWVRLMKRKDFTPTMACRLCSMHFSPESFEQSIELRAQLGSEFKPRRLRLKADAEIQTGMVRTGMAVFVDFLKRCRGLHPFSSINYRKIFEQPKQITSFQQTVKTSSPHMTSQKTYIRFHSKRGHL